MQYTVVIGKIIMENNEKQKSWGKNVKLKMEEMI